jgi:hypothetical protein
MRFIEVIRVGRIEVVEFVLIRSSVSGARSVM